MEMTRLIAIQQTDIITESDLVTASSTFASCLLCTCIYTLRYSRARTFRNDSLGHKLDLADTALAAVWSVASLGSFIPKAGTRSMNHYKTPLDDQGSQSRPALCMSIAGGLGGQDYSQPPYFIL